ncbi:MAG TPA: S-adenosylmethionine decarboxylase [Gemmatimonadaceae bacterium]|nr:S-adenosylmethionine decarboxylase [Gemmatimonadaceae bacterium]
MTIAARHAPGPVAYNHLVADFIGVPSDQLRDSALLSGLIIAAASAAGLPGIGIPSVRKSLGGGSIIALLQPNTHIVVHSFPEAGLLLLDVLASESCDLRKGLDVFSRRLAPRETRSDIRARG